MTVLENIRKLLENNNIQFKEFKHKPVRTSEEADSIRPEYSSSQGAKALILSVKYSKDNRKMIMVVLPGDKRIDSKKLRKLLSCQSFSFASEDEVVKVTNGVLPGGVPPFGNLFGLKVYVDPSLSENEEIIFNAGDRSVSIAMKYTDYENLVNPEIIEIV